jgi:uncharacterized protein
MKNSFLAYLLIYSSLVFSQKNDVESNIKLYTQVWDNVINKGQIDQINTKNFHESVIMVMNPVNIVGIEGFKSYYQNFLTGFSEIQFTIKKIFGQEENLVKHWHFKGRHTGAFFGLPATGKFVDIEGVTIIKMKNGKIYKEQDFMDSMIFQQQLGLISNSANMITVNNLYNSFSKGDVPSVLGAMDVNIIWNEAEGNKYADGNPYIGPDAVLNGVFGRVLAEHEYFNLDDIILHEMYEEKVLATLRYKAKNKNGNEYDAQVAHLWTLKDGKIIAFQQFVDTKKLNDSLLK